MKKIITVIVLLKTALIIIAVFAAVAIATTLFIQHIPAAQLTY